MERGLGEKTDNLIILAGEAIKEKKL